MSAVKRIADGAHKVVVTGLFGTFCYTSYAVTSQLFQGKDDNTNAKDVEHPQAGFIQMLRDKAAEEYKKYYKTDHREWYDKDVSLAAQAIFIGISH
jgi:hypothetical protein